MALKPPEARQRRGRRRGSPLWWGVLALVLVIGTAAGLWFALPLRSVTVTGNRFLTQAQVLSLAGLTPPFYGGKRGGGWLYYGGWRAPELRASPWIAAARIVRTFPGKVEIALTERTPAARWQQPDAQVYTVGGDGQRQPGIRPLGRRVVVGWDGQEHPGTDAAGKLVVVAWDGTVLPGAAPSAALPLLSGWGPGRLPDALRAALLLARYNVLSVRATPSGISVQTSAGTLWSGSMDALLKYSGGVKMFANKHINIYPWGVSVQQ
ncbi:cell division protein FtsQ/DivIB [Deinococcus sp.]|uniref:cell division protein FtsQ/DivIB n=1 Tax=Deinococcus sp. TaxID=47478 RepID=UPI003CC57FE4